MTFNFEFDDATMSDIIKTRLVEQYVAEAREGFHPFFDRKLKAIAKATIRDIVISRQDEICEVAARYAGEKIYQEMKRSGMFETCERMDFKEMDDEAEEIS